MVGIFHSSGFWAVLFEDGSACTLKTVSGANKFQHVTEGNIKTLKTQYTKVSELIEW